MLAKLKSKLNFWVVLYLFCAVLNINAAVKAWTGQTNVSWHWAIVYAALACFFWRAAWHEDGISNRKEDG